MPSFERVRRSLELHLAKDDPVRLAYLKGKHEAEDKGRLQIAGLAAFCGLLIFLLLCLTPKVEAQDCRDIFLDCETIILDDDDPDQDPVYDEDDPVYDEMDDYEDD